MSSKARDKVAGPAWDALRTQFDHISEAMLSVAPESFADLTTIYIKFTLTNEPTSPVYAVMWVKSSKNLVIGFALPEAKATDLGPAPKGMAYKSLTGYFVIEPGQPVSPAIRDWAEKAYSHVKSQ